MILDALTRAEHERQLEKQPDLKFVTPVKPQKKNPNKLWLWVGLAVLANAIILFILVRALSGDTEKEVPLTVSTAEPQQPAIDALATNEGVQPSEEQFSQAIIDQQLEVKPVLHKSSQIPSNEQQEIKNTLPPIEARPLAMEANSVHLPEVDRPLLYESKQPSLKPKAAVVTTSVKAPNTTKGNVSFSSTELSADDALPISNKPKLLIDGVSNGSSSDIQNVRDLPDSSRAALNQYEVNVHVFDDDPIRRFVLINMDKYKEGDRIANNGPLVEEITSKGVVIDYGRGRALLPAK